MKIPSVGEDMEHQECSEAAGRRVNGQDCLREQPPGAEISTPCDPEHALWVCTPREHTHLPTTTDAPECAWYSNSGNPPDVPQQKNG